MRNLLLTVIIIVFTVGCNRSQKTGKSGSAEFDTITLKDNEVLFISPSDKNIQKLKKKHGEGFYTIADDANYYFSEASSYLDSQKTPYKSYDDDKIIVFKKNNKAYKIPKYKSPWYLIFYKDEKYELLDLISIKDRYPKFFKDKTHISPPHFDSKKIIDSIAGKEYFVVDEKECDLNADTFKDKIIVLGNNSDYDPQNPATKIAPVIILLNQRNNNYEILTNESIYPNDFADVFKALVIKDNFFTVELSNEVPDQYISKKYITFKFNRKSKEIVLSKYGEIINWNDGERTNVLCSDSDFGKILFQEFSSDNIRTKCIK